MPIPFPPPERRGPRPSRQRLLLDELRSDLLSRLHTGLIHPGDRLPSIREMAQDRGYDHRFVARACRTLEAEGLLEIRGRSGVFVAGGSTVSQGPPADQAVGMLSRMMAEAWQHELCQKELARLVSRGLNSTGLCCACVESNRDQMVAYTTEIESISGVTTLPFYIGAGDRDQMGDAGVARRLNEALAHVDLMVTTEYHAHAVRSAIRGSGVPLVLIGINPELVAAVRRRLTADTLTVIAVTAEFGDRMRLMYGDTRKARSRIRVILASDASALRDLGPDAPVLMTRAARELLPGLANVPMIFPHSPTLSSETLAELSRAIVTANLRRRSA